MLDGVRRNVGSASEGEGDDGDDYSVEEDILLTESTKWEKNAREIDSEAYSEDGSRDGENNEPF
jgi:hypothetical protein